MTGSAHSQQDSHPDQVTLCQRDDPVASVPTAAAEVARLAGPPTRSQMDRLFSASSPLASLL